MATISTVPASWGANLTKFGSFTPDAAAQLSLATQATFYTPLRADVQVTSAQLLAIQATPITLVAAPGAGLMIVPLGILVRMFGGTQYTDAGGAMSVAVGSYSQAFAATTVITGPTAAGQRSQQYLACAATSTAAAPPTNENAACTLSKATNSFAAGTGTAHVTLFYTVELATV